MARRAIGLITIAVTACLTLGCGGSKPTGTWTEPTSPAPVTATAGASEPTAGPTTTPPVPGTTTPPAGGGNVLTVDGIGPYAIGATLDDLRGRGLLTNVVASPHCDNAFGAEATGGYAGRLTFTFVAGRLIAIHTTSTTLRTPSGGKVGMSLSDLQGIYGTRGEVISNGMGGRAYIVRVTPGSRAALFLFDAADRTVALSVGEAEPLAEAIRTGEGC